MPTKRTSSTRETSSANPTPLAEFLETFVIGELLQFQATGSRAVRESLLDLLHPQRSQVFDFLGRANERMSVVHGRLKEELREDRLYPWVLPSFASVLFEGVVHSCAGVWLLAGDSEDPSKLKPAVEDCVHLEVKAFVAGVGGGA